MSRRPIRHSAAAEARVQAEVERVYVRLIKELKGRIVAEVVDAESREEFAAASTGWAMALADALATMHVAGHVPIGMLMEMIFRSLTMANPPEPDEEDESLDVDG